MSRVNNIAQDGVDIRSGKAVLSQLSVAGNISAAGVTATAPVQLGVFTVANAPAATGRTGSVIFVSNGNAGAPCLAVSNGTNWLRIALGAAIAA